jgi:hypothetical protein
MNIEAGKKYYRKRGLCGAVRLVLAVTDGRVSYRVLHGPALKRTPSGACSLRSFASWADGEFEGDDYGALDGARLHGTFVVQGVAGQPLFRCSARRGRFYLRKGYAVRVDEGTLRFTDDTTERKLAHLYDGNLSPFFMEVKNDRCVVCGKGQGLTRHHVVPRRHKAKLPLEVRKRLSNILFVCLACHDLYESRQLVSESLDPHVWKDHFVETMRPRFLPKGWDIVLAVRAG